MIKLRKIDNKNISSTNITPMQNLNKQISIKNNQERNANHQSVFENLYMKKFISSLGKKYLKPEIPKSVFPKSRMSSVQFNRPGTAIYKLNWLVHVSSFHLLLVKALIIVL